MTKIHSIISLDEAFSLENEGSLTAAAVMYEKLLKKTPYSLTILARLMIIYRKEKKFKEEIVSINKAIAIHRKKYISTREKDSKVLLISKKINKLLGHASARGKDLLVIPEIEKMEKRRAIAEKKMNKK